MLKITKNVAFDGIELKEATFKNQCFPEHFHDSYSIGIIEEGIEKVHFANKDIIAHANAVIIINPYDVHANSFFDTDMWKYRIVYINQDVMKYIQHQAGLLTNKTAWFPKHLIDDGYLYQLIMDFHLAVPENKVAGINAALSYLLANYATERVENDNIYHLNEITDAVFYIKAHLAGKVNIEDMAAMYCMDKYKFIRAFKKQTGLTPISYLQLHRVNEAKLLITQNMPIVEVALETGFFDQSHFTHCFRKYIGISPLSYKKSIVID